MSATIETAPAQLLSSCVGIENEAPHIAAVSAAILGHLVRASPAVPKRVRGWPPRHTNQIRMVVLLVRCSNNSSTISLVAPMWQGSLAWMMSGMRRIRSLSVGTLELWDTRSRSLRYSCLPLLVGRSMTRRTLMGGGRAFLKAFQPPWIPAKQSFQVRPRPRQPESGHCEFRNDFRRWDFDYV